MYKKRTERTKVTTATKNIHFVFHRPKLPHIIPGTSLHNDRSKTLWLANFIGA